MACLALPAHVLALLDAYISQCSSDPSHHRSFGEFAGFFTSYVQRCAGYGGLFRPGGADASEYGAFCDTLALRFSDPLE
jgi:hypothetical protein